MCLHWKEYAAEMTGTLILVFVGVSAIIINLGHDSFTKQLIPDLAPRLLLTALMFAGAVSLVAISPFGKMSGGHINPALTLSFWLLKKMRRKDFAGYLIFQVMGATAGAGSAMLIWGRKFWDVTGGLTLPGPGISVLEALLTEAVLTFILVSVVLIMLSHHRTTRLTPLAVLLLLSLEIFLGILISGASMNPARSFGPAVVSNIWKDQWIYFVAPTVGALLATVAYHEKTFGTLELQAAKLFHTPYVCIFIDCKECERIIKKL